MNHAALFNGIGGFQIAAQWVGWENVFHCEIDKFCNKVVKHHFPKSICYEDIKEFDATEWRGKIDIISGGFPCQPYSISGKRKGTEDDRHLWPQMLRIIREVQPRYVVGENVRGLVNWSGGLVFEQVQADLEAAGYEVIPVILPACAVNAPHRRDRIWFVAHANGAGTGASAERRNKPRKLLSEVGREQDKQLYKFIGQSGITSHAGSAGREEQYPTAIADRPGFRARLPINNWNNWPTQSPVRCGNDGLSGKLDGITVSKHRNESLKAYGNAIVPQLAYEIFKAIEAIEATESN